METYSEKYRKIKKQEREFVKTMLDEIVLLFTTITLKPIIIGNMVYYYCEVDGKKVPAYCYLIDYQNGDKTFFPIYDKAYGWEDLDSVTRILDTIKRVVMENK